MDVRIFLLIAVVLTIHLVQGGFFFNPVPPTDDNLKERGLKCVPGRTIIRVEQPQVVKDDDSSADEDTRRSHMNYLPGDENCTICVCSVEGKDEYCKKRPAKNVNECIRMAILKKNMENNIPYSHERALSFRIRRDYIWHYDEIPYEPNAACRRGVSYYTNNINANDTDIDVPSDVDSLLDYSNNDICFFCVCSVNGKHSGCISRQPWFCNYYRIIRRPERPKENYKQIFQQDRPAYFRHLSFRLRRVMDEGVVAFMDIVGDESNRTKCIPYVSEYSDCTDANACSGCTRCSCTDNAEWNCEMVYECPSDHEDTDPETVKVALDTLYSELKQKENKKKARIVVPPPPNHEDELIVSGNNPYEESFESYFARQKRSISENVKENNSKNNTIQFYNTVDELNEDTLKDSNKTGTIEVPKTDTNSISKISRRTGMINNLNKSSLHIEYNQVGPGEEYDHHIEENKIEPTEHDSKLNSLLKYKLEKFIGNFSHTTKDTDLSKIVVNELKTGSEIVGNKHVSPMSNITFTSENDTLTAMAFIAGNLLNKLWDIEKDSSNGLIDTEVLKHEKINDLLELFKEPLNLRQEMFLKNALEKLSNTLNNNKNIKNVSLCETIEALEISSKENVSIKNEKDNTNKPLCDQKVPIRKKEEKFKKELITTNVVTKLNNVLNLIKKIEQVQIEINKLKPETNIVRSKSDDLFSTDETLSLDLFGNLLEKVTKLLMPNKSNKKLIDRLKKLNQFSNNDNDNLKNVLKDQFNFDESRNRLTFKDKVILDYIDHIENNPHCLLRKKLQETAQPKIHVDGSILFNLSQLTRVKSFVDLLNLIKDEKTQSTEAPIQHNLTKYFLRDNGDEKLNTTKEKLKNHLKAIIDDLLELQGDDTYSKKNKINIADALPCIYNIMNSDKIFNASMSDRNSHSPIDKLKTLIDSLKIEMMSNPLTRRVNIGTGERPQSSRILERVIKNIGNLQNTRRRSSYEKLKTYEELKDTIEEIELVTNSYKNFALFSGVSPHKRLMLLKTLEADTKQKMLALANIKKSLSNVMKLPLDKKNEIMEFVDNSMNSINLSINVLKNISKPRQNLNDKPMSDFSNINNDKEKLMLWPQFIKNKAAITNSNEKLTRDQIIVQIIENRIKLYLASKEVNDLGLKNDINYNIGKRILSLIRSGNFNVAKELFKVFIANQQGKSTRFRSQDNPLRRNVNQREYNLPFIPSENEPTRRVQPSPDNLFNKLVNLKNINFK